MIYRPYEREGYIVTLQNPFRMEKRWKTVKTFVELKNTCGTTLYIQCILFEKNNWYIYYTGKRGVQNTYKYITIPCSKQPKKDLKLDEKIETAWVQACKNKFGDEKWCEYYNPKLESIFKNKKWLPSKDADDWFFKGGMLGSWMEGNKKVSLKL